MWIVIGIISFLLIIGILIQFADRHAEDDKIITLEQSLDSLLQMCRSVCNMPQGTYLKTPADFASGTILTTKDNSICGSVGGEGSCRGCPCNISENIVLNLTGDARQFFFKHTYQCFFLRTEEGLEVECRG